MSVSSEIVAVCQAAVLTGDAPEYVVHEAIVPNLPFPMGWATVYSNEGTIQRLASCGAGDSAKVIFQVSCFGSTNSVTAWLRTRIRDYLIDVGVTVPGWTRGVVNHTYGPPPTPDESLMENPVVAAVDQFEMLISKL